MLSKRAGRDPVGTSLVEESDGDHCLISKVTPEHPYSFLLKKEFYAYFMSGIYQSDSIRDIQQVQLFKPDFQTCTPAQVVDEPDSHLPGADEPTPPVCQQI